MLGRLTNKIGLTESGQEKRQEKVNNNKDKVGLNSKSEPVRINSFSAQDSRRQQDPSPGVLSDSQQIVASLFNGLSPQEDTLLEAVLSGNLSAAKDLIRDSLTLIPPYS